MYSTLDLSLKRHTTFLKLRVAYNKVYRKILGLGRRSSASEMFVTNDILNFEALMRKTIFAFTNRLSISGVKLSPSTHYLHNTI